MTYFLHSFWSTKTLSVTRLCSSVDCAQPSTPPPLLSFPTPYPSPGGGGGVTWSTQNFRCGSLCCCDCAVGHCHLYPLYSWQDVLLTFAEMELGSTTMFPPGTNVIFIRSTGMCKSSRSSGAGPRIFTPSRSRSRSPYIGSPLNASYAEFFCFMLHISVPANVVDGGNRPPGGGGGPSSLGWGRIRGGGVVMSPSPPPPPECCRKCIVRRVGASYKASGPDASGAYDASYSVVQGVGARRVGDVRRVVQCRTRCRTAPTPYDTVRHSTTALPL